MFNIALGWTFVLSVLAFPPGGEVLALLFEPQVAHSIAPWRQALFTLCVLYWIPALVIYLAMRAFGVRRYLDASRGVQLLFAAPNAVLTVYVLLGVYAATPAGAGFAHMLAAWGWLFVIPSLGALFAASAWLAVRSARMQAAFEAAGRRLAPAPRFFSGAGSLLAIVALAPPLVFTGQLYLAKRGESNAATAERKAREARFAALCEGVRIDIRRTASGAKSVYFNSMNSAVYPLLARLDYVEVQGFGAQPGETFYVRFQKRPVIEKGRGATRAQPIEAPEAQYEIAERRLGSDADRKLGLAAVETTLRERASGETLAVFSYALAPQGRVPPGTPPAFCPAGFNPVSYQYEVSAYTLGLMDEKTAKSFDVRLARLKAGAAKPPLQHAPVSSAIGLPR